MNKTVNRVADLINCQAHEKIRNMDFQVWNHVYSKFADQIVNHTADQIYDQILKKFHHVKNQLKEKIYNE